MVDFAKEILDIFGFVAYLYNFVQHLKDVPFGTTQFRNRHGIFDCESRCDGDIFLIEYSQQPSPRPDCSCVVPVTDSDNLSTPSSLQVVPGRTHDLSRSCQVPTGNLTNGPPGSIMYQTGGWGYWTGITPVAQKLAYSTFIGQKIPQLPQPCGLNCTYSVSVPSIAFQCKEGVDLPPAMKPATSAGVWEEAFWNATAITSGSPPASFYVYWKSTTK